MDVMHDWSASAANSLANYLLVEQGRNAVFDTASCKTGYAGDDLRLEFLSAVYSSEEGKGPFLVTLNLPSALPAGNYRLFVCGSTSIRDVSGKKLNDGQDSIVKFRVISQPQGLPDTGFAPGYVSRLVSQPQEKMYTTTELSLDIPVIGLNAPIVGVPLVDGVWDVAWLADKAGWLIGTAFPTWAGNSVLTGHVWNADNTPGTFVDLKKLKYGDVVKVRAWGQEYIYEVRENRIVANDQAEDVLRHEQGSWLTLLTCEDYNLLITKYSVRRMVRAVLVSIRGD